MSRAGYRTGEALGNAMTYDFKTKAARVMDQIVSMVCYSVASLAVVAAFADRRLDLFEADILWPCVLIGVAALAVMFGMHHLARLLDRLLAKKKEAAQ